MYVVLAVFGFSCLGIIVSVLKNLSLKVGKHRENIYWMIALVGAILLVVFGLISPNQIWDNLTSVSDINPIKILVLFFSMTAMSVFLDEIGFFSFLANQTLHKAGVSQKKLFLYLYITVSILTIFTSNDIIILTFTPFICYFSKNAKINPIPYLIGEFVAANTWSMALIIGNPTNIYIATSFGITYIDYFLVMVIPTIAGGLVAFGVLYILFHKQLSQQIQPDILDMQISNKILLVIGLIHLGLCTLLLTISYYIGLEMWLICLAFALSLFLSVSIYKIVAHDHTTALTKTILRLPYQLAPFLIAMFVMVLALDKYGITSYFAKFLSDDIWSYGLSSSLMANLINNIPMSVLYSSIIGNADACNNGIIYASIIGSNLGALITPVGALAGIMWSNILSKHNVKFSFMEFVKYGIIIFVPTIVATLGVLAIILM